MSFPRAMLVASLAALNWLISSPPHPPPKTNEHSISNSQESRFLAIAALMVKLVQGVISLGSLCEIVIIIASSHPSALSTSIITFLVPLTYSESPANIRVTKPALLAWGVGASGCMLRFWSIRALGRLFTFQLAIRDDHRLVTTGPYAFVRHPAYTGSILGAVGTASFFLSTGSYLRECGVIHTHVGLTFIFIWMSWKVFMAMNLVRRTGQEDAFLKAEFGQRWVEWSKNVRYHLIPGLY